MEWISTKDRLPEEGKYVLARHNRGNWWDSDDQVNVNCVVVKLVRGISIKEREQMRSGEIPNPKEELVPSLGRHLCNRSEITKQEDEEGNNLVPYGWEQFGPASFFGQDISHWTKIEPL